MKRKLISLLLAAMLVLCVFTGCEAVSDIAGNVADAAKAELEAQVKEKLEEYKVEVVEVRTAVGKLNGEEDATQFFCAALVKANSDTLPASCADALDKIFEETGVLTQTGSKVDSPYLEHKDVSFKHSDFSEGNYYTIYVYNTSLTGDLLGTEGK